MRDRKTGESEQVAVATCVLADREGPVLVDLWRDVATSTVALFNVFSEESDASFLLPPLVEFKYFGVKAENRKAVNPMRKVVTSERTAITRLRAGTRPTVTEMLLKPPLETLFIRDLTRLQQEPPYVVSVAGIIGSCVEEQTTATGRPRRGFQLHDQSGRYVLCAALGRHSSNSCIQNGNEVVLYFAQALAPTSPNNASGQLWLYDESHMVVLQEKRSIPTARTVIELRAPSRW